jgi:hypothetical protein
MSIKAWIVGRVAKWDAENSVWHFQGVYSTLELAEAACRDEDYFVGPAIIDEQVPHEPLVWPGAWYPLLESRDEMLERCLREAAAPVLAVAKEVAQ